MKWHRASNPPKESGWYTVKYKGAPAFKSECYYLCRVGWLDYVLGDFDRIDNISGWACMTESQ